MLIITLVIVCSLSKTIGAQWTNLSTVEAADVSVLHLERFGLPGCVANVISIDWVVTAASCIDIPLDNITLHVGTLVQDAKFTATLIRKVIHPYYSGLEYSANNIGLIQVTDTDLTRNRGITSIPLNIKPRKSFYGYQVQSYGQKNKKGLREINLQEANFEILTEEECEISDKMENSPSLFCVGNKKRTMELCPDTIGSPLLSLYVKPRVLIGILTGTRCNGQFASVFEDVAIQMDWITAHTGKLE